jgi:hypothetical protein
MRHPLKTLQLSLAATLLGAAALRGADDSKGLDPFAAIATQGVTARAGLLEELPPPVLPDIQLQSSASNSAAAFTPVSKIDTAEKLKVELARVREKHAPFMKDLSPKLENLRIVQKLGSFQWRMESDLDRGDFLATLAGKGEWKQVKIPHYGGPVGRAAAYYRSSFTVTKDMLAKGAVFTRFRGVDYKAQVFVNGHCVGTHEGFFAPFEFECAKYVREGENTLLVKVENDATFLGYKNPDTGKMEFGDKVYAATGPGWDDPEHGWSHCPPGFGIYQDVTVEARAPLCVTDLWVRPVPAEKRAEAWIEVWSKDREEVPASVEISVYGQNFEQTVVKDLKYSPGTKVIPGHGDLQKPTDNADVALEMGPGLNRILVPISIPEPRIWSPDTPWLYRAQVRLLDAKGRVLDTASRQFGMRTFTQDTVNTPKGRHFLNGKEIKLRGTNTMGYEQQDVMKGDDAQLVDDILLAKICNLNYMRLTQRPVQDEVYEACDRLGMLTQTDLPLFGSLRYNKFAECVRQVEEMERMVRPHACNIEITYINEPFPNGSGRPHRNLIRPELQAFFEAADRAVHVLNPDRVIKHVDGDYDPPTDTLPDNHCYPGWYNGHGMELGRLHRGWWMPVAKDWLYACGEFGAEGIDTADLMRRLYPKTWLPTDAASEAKWSPGVVSHAQTGNFHFMWFDTQKTLEGWAEKSREHQAWVTRMIAERFRRDDRMCSFAIHLFIDAFPANWMKTIMDYERNPKPAFFAYRDALEPLTVDIRTDRWKYTAGEKIPFEFRILNDTHEYSDSKYTLRWQIERDGKPVFSQESPAKVAAMKTTFQGFFTLVAPQVPARTKFTVRLALCDGGKVIRDTSVNYEVFPALEKPRVSVGLVGKNPAEKPGKAAQLYTDIADLGTPPTAGRPAVLLVDDYAAYAADKVALDAYVSNGARLIFLELPVGTYDIGGDKVVVEDCVMRPRQFVSRDTGHRFVADCEEQDFKCWYDAEAGYFRPLLNSMFDAPGWTPILVNGNGVWGGKAWVQKLAVAEKKSGKGSYIVSQISLSGRTKENPTAAIFARRLLGAK